MREVIIERYLVRGCNERGYDCWKFTRPGKRAAFDRLIPLPGGRVIWVETKQPGKVLRGDQAREQLRLELLGHVALMLNSIESIDRFFWDFLQ